MWKNLWHILLTVQTFCIRQTWTDCVGEFDFSTCVYNVKCTDSTYIYPSREYYKRHSECNNYVYTNQRYVPITVVFRKTLGQKGILSWSFDDGDLIDAIVSIDLSNNQDISLSPYQSMANLKFLNISHNSLTDTMLDFVKNFPMLSAIDLSYNMIIDTGFIYNLGYCDKLKKLDLSHNAIYNIPDAVFENISQLEYLNLSYNHISTLCIFSFEGLKNLRSLYLEYNYIIDINSSLLRFKYLEELSLKHNRIVKIQRRDFQNLFNLRKIDLSLNNITEIEKPTFQHLSFLQDLDLSNNALQVVSKENFNGTDNLRKVDLSTNKIKHLPTELFKGKKISFFLLKDNILEDEIITGMFLGLGNVTCLNISNQYVTGIEDNAFFGLESLEILLLNNNKIKSVSKNAFISVPTVKHIDLSNNYIVSLDFEKKYLLNLRFLSVKNNLVSYLRNDTLISLNKLESIDISNNNITEIDNPFKALRLVTDFKISNNSLKAAIDSKTFDGITLIPSIDISYSRISLVKNNTFQFMSRLSYLNMSHSLINELQFNSFAHISRIVTIDISFNRLTSFIVNTTYLSNLCTLILHNNLLTEISTVTLKSISNLVKVSFAYNKLEAISISAFADQKSLSELDVSFNPLLNLNFTKFINFGNLHTLQLSGTIINISFQQINSNHITKLELSHAKIENVTSLWLYGFEHVEILTLNNNEISSIDKDAFARIIYLQNLDMSYNKIKYIQPGAFKNNHNLQTLIISHNYLTSINYGTFRGLSGLNILDLSYNKIESLEGLYWQEVNNLDTLIIDENRLRDLDYFKISRTQLSKLSLGDNPLDCNRIHEMKQNLHFQITALREDEHIDNVDGIVCNKNRSISEDQGADKTEESGNIIRLLKKFLLNSSVPNISSKESENGDSKLLENVTDVIQKSNGDIFKQLSVLNDVAFSISNNNNQTNSLLERLLKVVVIMNSAIRPPRPPLSENVTRDNLTIYMNKVKQELEEDMLVQKESIIADLDSKISMPIHRKQLVQNEMTSNDAKTSRSDVGLIEICVILILIIAVSFIVFKLWKWYNRSPSNWLNTSLSRQHIIESLENSQL